MAENETEAQKLKAVRDILTTLVWKDNPPRLPAGGHAVTGDGYEIRIILRSVEGPPGAGWMWDWSIFHDGVVLGGGGASSLIGAQRFAAEELHELRKRG